MYTNTNPFRLVLPLAALLLWLGTAQAKPSVGPEIPMGMIPGTRMMRDEFRARAFVQLNAIALNALSYWLIHGEYPADFAHLKGSDCWVLEPSNIFKDRPVRGIDFQPTPTDMTNAPPLGLGEIIDFPRVITEPGAPPAATAPAPGTGDAAGDTGNAGSGDGAQTEGGQSSSNGYSALQQAFGQAIQSASPASCNRVNPLAISDKAPGDVFYFSRNGLLQLVMFAPDGTFFEVVDEVPRHGWVDRLRMGARNPYNPQGITAAAVLYFTEYLIPQYTNLVDFMSDNPRILGPASKLGVQQRLDLAGELKIAVRNPFSKQAASIATSAVPGCFYEADATQPMPLRMCLPDGTALTLDELVNAGGDRPSASEPTAKRTTAQPKQPAKRRGAPPMGGKK